MSWGDINWAQLAAHVCTTLVAVVALCKWFIKSLIREEVAIVRAESATALLTAKAEAASALSRHNQDSYAHPSSAITLRLSEEVTKLEELSRSLGVTLAVVQDRQNRE